MTPDAGGARAATPQRAPTRTPEEIVSEWNARAREQRAANEPLDGKTPKYRVLRGDGSPLPADRKYLVLRIDGRPDDSPEHIAFRAYIRALVEGNDMALARHLIDYFEKEADPFL